MCEKVHLASKKPLACGDAGNLDECEYITTDLLPGNREAWGLYQEAQGQTLQSGDLNFLAISGLMDLYRVADRRRCYEKVKRIFFIMHDVKEKMKSAKALTDRGSAPKLPPRTPRRIRRGR